jgi:hypothetical protein
MNDDVLEPVLLSKQRNQKRIGTQKWKRHVLMNARRGLLNTTCSEMPTASSNILNKPVEGNLKSSNVCQDSNEYLYELNIDTNEYGDSHESNINTNEYDFSKASHVDNYEFDDFNLLNIDTYENDDISEINVDEYLCEHENSVFDFTSYFTQPDMYLHQLTNVKKNEYCKNLLLLFRDANICKTHADRFIRLIHTVLPSPNNLPKSMKQLLLDMQGNIYEKHSFQIVKFRIFIHIIRVTTDLEMLTSMISALMHRSLNHMR